jgi:hypothetical protein
MMRTFLPSTLSQPELPSAIQLLGSSNVDLREMGDDDIVAAPPGTQPHSRHPKPGNDITRGVKLNT